MKSQRTTILFGFAALLFTATAFAQNEPPREISVLEGEIGKLEPPEELLPPTQQPVPKKAEEPLPTAKTISEIMLAESNNARANAGRSPQKLSATLTRAAQQRADKLALTGLLPNTKTTPGARHENIAFGQKSVESVFKAWQNSSAHRANLSTADATAGFGHAVGENGVSVWVALYGSTTSAVKVATVNKPVANTIYTPQPSTPTYPRYPAQRIATGNPVATPTAPRTQAAAPRTQAAAPRTPTATQRANTTANRPPPQPQPTPPERNTRRSSRREDRREAPRFGGRFRN